MLCPSLFLYVVWNRFSLLYAIPIAYFLMRLSARLFGGNQNEGKPMRELVLLPLLLGGLGICAFLGQDLYFLPRSFIRDNLILFSFILPFWFHHRFEDRHIKALFGTEVLAYLIWIDPRQWNRFFVDLFASRSFSEYDMGLFFGLFFLYFLLRKDWKWFFASLFILVLVSKRAVWLGLFPPILWWALAGLRPQIDRPPVRRIALLSVYASLLFFSFYVVDFVTWIIHDIAGKRTIQIDHVLNGRAFSLNFINFKIRSSDAWNLFLGHGAGQLDAQISLFRPVFWAKYFPEPSNPHNDLLKILFDFGILGTIGFAGWLSTWFSRTRIGVLLFLYTLILYFFDNSLIHLYYNLFAMVLCQTEAYEKAVDQP